MQLTSKYEVRQVVTVQLRPDVRPMLARITAIRFLEEKVMYDLAIYLHDDTETRIHNVDSYFVFDFMGPQKIAEWAHGIFYPAMPPEEKD